LDLTEREFLDHYVPGLKTLLGLGCCFVIGDAKGTDLSAQQWLHAANASVTVFHMLDAPRNNVGHFPAKGGFKSDRERDEAMTAVSNIDLAWVRPGREKSGTAKNLQRRFKRTDSESK
jgi:hypothetical protein